MPKIGHFKNDASREAYNRVYRELESKWPLPSTQHDIPTSFGHTHVRQSGEGTLVPLILIHSLGANGLQWEDMVTGFARDRVVYTIDTIGTAGRSVQTAPLSDESDFARWLEEVLTGLGVDRAHLIGYSHGAWHAMLAAIHAPRRVASVSLIEPGGVFDKPSGKVLWKMIRFGMRRTDENMRKMQEWMAPGYSLNDAQFAMAKEALNYRMKLGWARKLTDVEMQSITVHVGDLRRRHCGINTPGRGRSSPIQHPAGRNRDLRRHRTRHCRKATRCVGRPNSHLRPQVRLGSKSSTTPRPHPGRGDEIAAGTRVSRHQGHFRTAGTRCTWKRS